MFIQLAQSQTGWPTLIQVCWGKHCIAYIYIVITLYGSCFIEHLKYMYAYSREWALDRNTTVLLCHIVPSIHLYMCIHCAYTFLSGVVYHSKLFLLHQLNNTCIYLFAHTLYMCFITHCQSAGSIVLAVWNYKLWYCCNTQYWSLTHIWDWFQETIHVHVVMILYLHVLIYAVPLGLYMCLCMYVHIHVHVWAS